MKKVVWSASFLLAVVVLSSAYLWHPSQPAATVDQIKWYTWDEAIALSKTTPKKIFVDVYTDWCGYCKRMDASTFTDAAVISYMNENFYAVKFNAEQTADVQYKGYTLRYQGAGGRRGYHELAAALLDNRMSYPSFVYLDENQDRITISPGYKTPDVLINELRFVAGNHYKTMRIEQFKGQ